MLVYQWVGKTLDHDMDQRFRKTGHSPNGQKYMIFGGWKMDTTAVHFRHIPKYSQMGAGHNVGILEET